jgi:hypothetical protein
MWRTEICVCKGKALYPLSHSSSPFYFSIFQIGSMLLPGTIFSTWGHFGFKFWKLTPKGTKMQTGFSKQASYELWVLSGIRRRQGQTEGPWMPECRH